MGPNTKNASNEPVVKVEAKDKAKKASTVEQTDTTTAKSIIAKIELTAPCPKLRIISRGMVT